jgi:hypothetical protein
MEVFGKIVGALLGYLISAAITVYAGVTVLNWLGIPLVL